MADLREYRGRRRAIGLRTVVTRDGSVLKCPSMGNRFVSEAMWRDFYEAQVARPYDEDDPYAREVGGGDA